MGKRNFKGTDPVKKIELEKTHCCVIFKKMFRPGAPPPPSCSLRTTPTAWPALAGEVRNEERESRKKD